MALGLLLASIAALNAGDPVKDQPVSVAEPAPVVQTMHHHTPGDPWEGVNRRVYRVNLSLDKYLFRPVTQTYRRLLPKTLRGGIHNALRNWDEPSVFFNNVLQLRPRQAGAAAYRFAVNSTVGVVGLVDVADRTGVPHEENDFSLTLGRYGVPSGPYLYLPFAGPSSVRDLTGDVVDLFTNPLTRVRRLRTKLVEKTQAVVSVVDARVRVDDDLQNIALGATDPYASLRSIYTQRIAAQVSGDEFSLGDSPEIPGAPELPPTAPAPKPAASTPKS